ncbi:GGDEF domain-containing protein [Burkholderia gladioli]|uniref:GGDEF domain-containing protein n=1 Tax=Burkholderia gladioli TaxID=28095 RepID=UPI0016400614|nr:diguanylate cyclase [Burkholderia gladioli]
MEVLLDSPVSDAAAQRQIHELLESFKTVWAKEYRNEHGGLTLKASDAGEIFKSSVRHLAMQCGVDQLCVVYIDLDHFKEVNKHFSHETGNEALRRAYAFMHEIVRDLNGLVFFDGGDEFIMIVPATKEHVVASRLADLKEKLRTIRFEKHGEDGSIHVSLDMTAGMVVRSLDDISIKINEIKTECEDLTKDFSNGGEKKRGTINFEQRESLSVSRNEAVSVKDFFSLGIVISKARVGVEVPFADDFLNLVAQRVSAVLCDSVSGDLISPLIENLAKWFGKQIVPTVDSFDESSLLIGNQQATEVSEHAIIVAIAHGLAMSASKKIPEEAGVGAISIGWNRDTGRAAVLYDDSILWGSLASTEDAEKLAYGPARYIGSDNETNSGSAILVQIGFPDEPKTVGGSSFPDDCFISHVRVDARPAINGGLPDFWQIALAQVVSAYSRFQDGVPVLVWGPNVEETLTYNRLKEAKDWNIDELAALTGLPGKIIQEIGKQLSSSVKIVGTAANLLEQVYDAYLSGHRLSLKSTSSVRVKPEAVLQREMAAGTPLRQSEGIVCETASVAYPLVIDTLRRSLDVRTPIDDADQELRELIAFKIKLTRPGDDVIPYYLREYEDDLEQYAKRVLLEKGGVIRASLEDPDQCSVFIRHLSSYFRANTKHRSTRRACLIVPQRTDANGEPKPLGLISVWATPRFEGEKRLIDFIFVWRTVEAFIGLPYSLFGSIRFAEQLTRAIEEAVKTMDFGGKVELGELSYVALSIHLGSDEFHLRVAKHIVDAASD